MTNSVEQYDVVVVGGGMVGAATALGLAKLGLSILLVERQAPNLDWSAEAPLSIRVSALTRSSENILRNLNAWQGIIEKRYLPFDSMRIWESNSKNFMRFDAAEIGEPNLGYTVENDLVQLALWEQIEKTENIVPLFSENLVALNLPEENSSEPAVLQFESMVQPQQLRTVEAMLVVGADGANSKSRQLASIGLETKDYEQCAVVGCVKTQKSHENACWQRYTEQGPFAFLAMAGGYSSIAWYLPLDKMQWALSLEDKEFAQQIEIASGGQLGQVTEVAQRGAFALVRRHANHYVKPRFALVGDAAHTINPQAGQGVNIGLLDAAALVEQMQLTLQKGRVLGNYPALRRYERARRGDNAMVQRSMEFFDWFYEQSSNADMKAELRRRFIPLVSQSMMTQPLKHWLMEQVLNGRESIPALAKYSSCHQI